MSCDIIYTKEFAKDVKRMYKKYRSLKEDLNELEHELMENPYAGTRISDDFYKIRLAIKSKGKGKSGGGRVVYHIDAKIVEEDNHVEITLLKLYDKSDQESVSTSEVKDMLDRHNTKEDEE
ncbi:MAG: type II toxin-antitoxin system RelE/ParE family toxin [Bacteroidota bacterium]